MNERKQADLVKIFNFKVGDYFIMLFLKNDGKWDRAGCFNIFAVCFDLGNYVITILNVHLLLAVQSEETGKEILSRQRIKAESKIDETIIPVISYFGIVFKGRMFGFGFTNLNILPIRTQFDIFRINITKLDELVLTTLNFHFTILCGRLFPEGHFKEGLCWSFPKKAKVNA